MSKRLRCCLSVFLCIVLVVGLNPGLSLALDANGSVSAKGSQQAADTPAAIADDSGAESDSTPANDTDKAPASTDEGVTAAAAEDEESEDGVAEKNDSADADVAAVNEAATAQKGDAANSGITTLAVTPKAGATYGAVTSSRDITENLLDPVPAVKFEHPVNSGKYYTVDELKATFGDDYQIYVGDSVHVKFNYKNLNNVQPNEGLTFPIPEGLEGSQADVKGIIEGADGAEQGRYWLDGGLIHMQFSNEYIAKTAGNVSNGFVNFYGWVDESAVEKPGIFFDGINIAPIAGHVGKDPNQKAAVKKWNGTPESTTETTYDATKNAEQFTIEIDTTGNTRPVDIDVTDVITFNPANVIDNNKAWTVDTDEAAAAGLTTSFTKDSNGKYVWSIKQMPANTKYKLTYWVYLDSANSTGNFSFTNEATPAIGNQTFNPAKTDGMEKHQFSVDKRVATNVSYDPATGKATATYEVKVTANANNSGTATNVSVVDTFKTGGKYVTDVKQTSSVGTISDKAQSGDNYSFKWNIGSIAPGETKTLTYTAEFDPNTLYFGADQGSKDRKDINNEAKVYEGDDTTPRATASASQRVDNQQATKGYEFDTATGKLKFTIVFNGKIPGTNKYFDSVLTNFTDQIQTAGVTYADNTPVLEAFNDSGVKKTQNLTDANIAGQSSFNIAIPQDMKGPYSYRLTYYVNVPEGIDPTTAIRNTMTAQGVGINGTSPFSLSDTATATVADTYSASLSKGVNYAQVAGPEGEFDRIEWTLTVSSPVPAGATITDVADNRNENGNFPNVFNNGDMMDPDVTKLCIMNGKDIASTLERGVDYDLTWQGSEMVLTFLKPVTGISKENPLRFFYRTQLVPTDDMYAAMSQPTFPKGDSDHSFNGLNYCSAGNNATLNVNGLTATAENRTTVNGGFEKYNGTYDSASREIQWKAGLYWNSHNGYVIQGERTITENIAPDQVISRVTDPNGNEIPFTVSADGRTVTFKVNWSPNDRNDFVYVYTKMNEQYLIEHGQDPDHLVDYEVTNTASIDGFGTQVAVGATAKVTETGTLTKDYKYSHLTEQNSNGVEFTLNVNPNASDLDPESDTLTIQDTMNRSLVLDTDSIRINGQTIADFGQGAALRYTKNSNHFELDLPDGVACTVTYAAKIVGAIQGEDGWLSNTAQILGRPGKATIDETSTPRLEVGAGAFSAVPFFVKKLDGDQQLVSGAEFMLKRVDLVDGQLVETDAVDSDGEIVSTSNDDLDGTYRWLGLLPTTPTEMGGKGYVYVITEAKAPTGCELDATPKYIAFAEPSDQMKQALADAGKTLSMVSGGGANNVAGMFAFNDENTDEKIDIAVNKTWNDNDNSEGFRPQQITINLIRDYNVDNPAQTVTVTADEEGNWTHTFTGLDKYETVDSTRHECTYTVTEDAVPEYTTVVSGSAADGYTVTNTHEVAKTSIQGLKFWNDNGNAANKRDTITVGVFADGADTPVKTVEVTKNDVSLSDGNYWTYTINDLNKYKNDGQRTPIVYTLKEVNVPAGYESTEGNADNNYTVINTFTGFQIDINKVDDKGNPVSGATLELKEKDQNAVDPGDGDGDGDGEGGLIIEALDPEGATWTTDLNAKSFNLQPGTYVLTETSTPDGYQTAAPIEFTVNADGTVTGPAGVVSGDELNIVSMTDARKVIDVPATKVWNDENNFDKVRPDKVTLGVFDSEDMTTPVATYEISKTDVGADANTWTHTFTNLPEVKTVNGVAQTITYVVRELNANGGAMTDNSLQANNRYTVTYDDDANQVTNTCPPQKIAVPVTKAWVDDNNQDGLRPDSVTIRLLADGVDTGKTVTLNNENGWTDSFSNLDPVKDGAAIEYTISEVAVTGYSTLITAAADTGFTVTNTHGVAKTSVTVDKVWNDSGNADGLRPSTIKIQLTADGQNVGDPVELSIADAFEGNLNTWTYTFTNLPVNKLDQDGKAVAIKYAVEEVAVPDGYTAKTDYATNNDGTTTATITNSHDANHDLTINKVDDQGNPVSGATLKLTESGSDQGATDPGDGDDEGGLIIEALDPAGVTWVTDGTAKSFQLEPGKYVLTEVEAPAGYEKSDPIEFTVTPDGTVIGPEGVVSGDNMNIITMVDNRLLTSVSGTKTWNDANNQDGKRPASVTLGVYDKNDMTTPVQSVSLNANNVTENDSNVWNYSFTDLPKFKDGVEVTYVVREIGTVDGYTATYEDNNVINTHEVVKVSVSGTKVWNDNKNQDGKRPGTIHIKVMNGTTVAAEKDITGGATDDTWTYEFTGLPKFANGVEIPYTVVETGVDGYQTTYEGNQIINSYTPGKTSVSVTKDWQDFNDQDGVRPGSVTIHLFADGHDTGKTATLDANSGWKGSFTNLDQYANGQLIAYTVTEDAVESYDAPVVTGTAKDGFVVTNKRTPDVTSISGNKAWFDQNDQDGVRPDEVTLGLFDADDMTTAVKTVTVSANTATDFNTWTFSFANVQKNKVVNGQSTKINYVVRELDGNGVAQNNNTLLENERYTVAYDDATHRVSNTCPPKKVAVEVSKDWQDDANRDGVRPDGVTIHLFADGVDTGKTVTLNERNGWKASFEELDALRNGGIVVKYTVTEDAVDGYAVAITGSATSGYKVVNEHAIQKTNVTATKVWNDNNNQDGKRPANVTVGVYDADDMTTPVKTAELSTDAATAADPNAWSCTFTDLPMNKQVNGATVKITYVVREIGTVEGYTATSDDATNTVTNTHEIEKTKVVATKVWNDRNNKENKRPANIEFQLFANGVAQGNPVSVSANADGNWVCTFEGLDKYKDGSEIVYTVQETQVAGYDPAIITGSAKDGYVVTNNETARKVVINKVNEGGNAVADCTLTVTEKGQTTAIDTWTTDGTSHEMQLKPGQYVLSETKAAVGYNTADDIEFTVNDDGTITCATNPATGADLNILSMVDTLSPNDVSVAKVDGDNKPLAGAELKITGKDANGNAIDAIVWTSSASAFKTQLPAGNYVLTETKVPDASKYQVAKDIAFEVALDGSVLVNGQKAKDATITMVDEFVPAKDNGTSGSTSSAKGSLVKTGDALGIGVLLVLVCVSVGAIVIARRKRDGKK